MRLLETEGNEKAIEALTRISPVAWQHILLNGHYTFQNSNDLIDLDTGFAPIFPDTCYHLTHYWLAAVDIPVASDNPVHYADAIRYNA